MLVLVGIDDTDNLESRGTGYRARHLGELIGAFGLGTVKGITRHQLLVDPAIPYTSHNSSVCLSVFISEPLLADLTGFCRDYLQRESAPGADAGLCLARAEEATARLQDFGRRAQSRVLSPEEAWAVAVGCGVLLEGLTGDGGGIIGALAAVGLRASGHDGRFLWVRGLRELQGVYTAGHLCAETGLQEIATLEGTRLLDTARIDLGPWPRPVLRGGKAVLLVEEVRDNVACQWRVVPKEIIKRY